MKICHLAVSLVLSFVTFTPLYANSYADCEQSEPTQEFSRLAYSYQCENILPTSAALLRALEQDHTVTQLPEEWVIEMIYLGFIGDAMEIWQSLQTAVANMHIRNNLGYQYRPPRDVDYIKRERSRILRLLQMADAPLNDYIKAEELLALEGPWFDS